MNLQAFGSVDGSEGPEHPQHPQDLHHRNGAGAKNGRKRGASATGRATETPRQRSTYWRKKEVSDTLTTSRSRRLKAFLQKDPVCRNAP